MKIHRIEVENFKSIEKYDFDVQDFTVFIGKNNHGKTNLFDALDWFDSGKTKSSFYRNNNSELIIKVRLHFNDVQSSLVALPDGTNKTKMQKALGEFDELIVEKTSETDKRNLIINGENIGNPSGIDPALNYFLPKIVYITTKKRLADVAGYKSKSPIAEMLSDVLKDMVDNEPKYQKFLELFDELFNTSDSVFRTSVNDLQERVESYLSKQFAEDAIVKFKIENPEIEDMLKKFETEVDDGVVTKAEEKGDGMQRALMLAIVQAYAEYRKEKNIARNFLFLIDEAELHLHPTAQRLLKKALRDIVDTSGQVLISSHSSIFANEVFENQMIYRVEKKSSTSELFKVEDEQEQMNSIYELLGGSPRDILLPSNFIIVEGKSDYEFLQKVIKRFYAHDKKSMQIKIIHADGDHSKAEKVYQQIQEAYKPLLTNGIYKKRVVFFLDKPNAGSIKSYSNFRKNNPELVDDEHIHILPVEALETYYPDPHRKNESEVKKMSSEIGAKVALAKEVGNSITQAQLNSEMPVVVQVIEKAIELAYE